MRHLHSGRKLGRSPEHRRATLRALTLALIENEAIKTIPSRAKELRWYADRVVTLAKKGDVASRRQMIVLLGSTQTNIPGENRVRNAIEKVVKQLAPRYKDRQGGYTQIFRLANRRPGDNAEQCIMQYIPEPESKKGSTAGDKKSAKRSTPSKKVEKTAASAVSEDKPTSEKKAVAQKASDKPSESKKSKAVKKD